MNDKEKIKEKIQDIEKEGRVICRVELFQHEDGVMVKCDNIFMNFDDFEKNEVGYFSAAAHCFNGVVHQLTELAAMAINKIDTEEGIKEQYKKYTEILKSEPKEQIVH